MSKIEEAAHYIRVGMLNHPSMVDVRVVGEGVVAVVDFGIRDTSLLPQLNQLADSLAFRFPGVSFSIEPLGESYSVDGTRGKSPAPSLVVPTIVK